MSDLFCIPSFHPVVILTCAIMSRDYLATALELKISKKEAGATLHTHYTHYILYTTYYILQARRLYKIVRLHYMSPTE